MADRYPQFPDRYPSNEYDRSRDRPHRDERGVMDRAGDEVRSFLGDDDAERRRRIDQQERERWESEDVRRRAQQESHERWSAAEPRWGQARNYGADRQYGDRDYGWRNNSAPDNQTYSRPSHEAVDRDRFAASPSASHERWRVTGPHAGRGPRGYQRADDRIHEEINDRLTAHGLIDATDVECRVQTGEVTLTGWVDSRAAKRAAEDLAEDVHGVREVHNQLRVRSHAGDDGVGRTSVLGLTEAQLQTPAGGRTADTSKPRQR